MSSSLRNFVPNPNDYDPISTLRKQTEARATTLIIRLQSCIEVGLVDTILKIQGVLNPNDLTTTALANSMDKLDVSETTARIPFEGSQEGASTKGASRSSKFFGKVKNHIDRGIHSFANNVQKATGDEVRRDLLTVGAYISNHITGKLETLGLTESFEIITGSSYESITFQIPISIPSWVFESSRVQSGSVIQFYLWVRSGASIFAKNKALRRYLYVGNSTMHLAQLADVVQKPFIQPVSFTLKLQSSYLNSGKMVVIAIPASKHPVLCGQGWSLTDPRVDVAYIRMLPMKKLLFNQPLDQSYIFSPKIGSNNLFLATERATESVIVLPCALALLRLFSTAANNSAQNALDINKRLSIFQISSSSDPIYMLEHGHMQCQLDVMHFLRYNIGGNGNVNIRLNFQRPDCIFERHLSSGVIPCFEYSQSMSYPTQAALSFPFYPRLVHRLDHKLIAEDNSKEMQVGKLRIEISDETIKDASGDRSIPIQPSGSIGTKTCKLETYFDLDAFINCVETRKALYLNVIDSNSGVNVGILGMQISVIHMNQSLNSSKSQAEIDSVDGGLVGMVGLNTLMEDSKACFPYADLSEICANELFRPTADTDSDRRKRQLATMGEFVSDTFWARHADTRRQDYKIILERELRYLESITTSKNADDDLPPHKRRDPRPFRPSSCRLESQLSSLGFNIHLQSFSISKLILDDENCVIESKPIALLQNTTCGAPSDHQRGFYSKGEGKGFSGGLRRLEATRQEISEKLRCSQSELINAVSNYYSRNNTIVNRSGKSLRHIPASETYILKMHTECRLLVEKLHEMTWDISLRRANVFSQALGIALTCYLSHISDISHAEKYASIWKQHGFLIGFEGLLSAAGKELGMIEDASVGIAMLRMVYVVLVTEREQLAEAKEKSKIKIPDTTYLNWIQIHPSGHGNSAKFLVEICVHEEYYAQRIPSPLKYKSQVQFFPVLHQMGVDIRQWGANAGANFSKNKVSETQDDSLDDDEIGIPDSDFLIRLNHEAFRKINAYAHSVFPTEASNMATWESSHSDQQISQPIHQSLVSLYEYIKSSAGRMEHGVLEEAGFAASNLFGGSVIFCKSGKDRTAMQVTHKQSQFVNTVVSESDGIPTSANDPKKVYDDSTLMRIYGTRLPICEKNVGQSLYAFNALQARFMPDPLKPPPRTLAGFLKGGKVFSVGGIES